MKFLVESKKYRKAELMFSFTKGGVEYLHVRFTSIQPPRGYGGYYEKDIPRADVIRIVRVKTKLEKWIIEQLKKNKYYRQYEANRIQRAELRVR